MPGVWSAAGLIATVAGSLSWGSLPAKGSQPAALSLGLCSSMSLVDGTQRFCTRELRPARASYLSRHCARAGWLFGAAIGLSACSRSSLPDPRVAAQAYARAAERGDAQAIYGMLTKEAQRTYGRAGTRQLVTDERAELRRAGRALASPNTTVRATARVRYSDGEVATLQIDNGRFRVASADALPAGARTPTEALAEFRKVLAERSYSGLMRVLTLEKRSSVNTDLRSLVMGLDQPETLDVKINGNTAEVRIPGGHLIKLKREEGVWRVDDFD